MVGLSLPSRNPAGSHDIAGRRSTAKNVGGMQSKDCLLRKQSWDLRKWKPGTSRREQAGVGPQVGMSDVCHATEIVRCLAFARRHVAENQAQLL